MIPLSIYTEKWKTIIITMGNYFGPISDWYSAHYARFPRGWSQMLLNSWQKKRSSLPYQYTIWYCIFWWTSRWSTIFKDAKYSTRSYFLHWRIYLEVHDLFKDWTGQVTCYIKPKTQLSSQEDSELTINLLLCFVVVNFVYLFCIDHPVLMFPILMSCLILLKIWILL